MREEQQDNEVIAKNKDDKYTILEHFDGNCKVKGENSQYWWSLPLTSNSGHPVCVGLRASCLGEAGWPDVGVGGEVHGGGRL